jgi:catechol 2,3-dioxygenase-like lactoylglutathione lyase family enzyme
VGRLAALALSLLAYLALMAVRAGGEPAPALVSGVRALGITVSDLERSAKFFTEVLDFEPVSEVELAGDAWERLQGVFPVRMRVARLRLGAETIELTEYLAPRGRPMPEDSRGNDLWFQHAAIVVSDMERAYARLRAHDVAHASSGPQRLPEWNRNAGGIEAFYFRDPDGHFLELIRFPAGKGDPRWQEGGGRLFLGIDHTAIVVSDTEASLAFYRDRLGLRVAGESENWGPEQERLNAVFAARLRVTALRAAAGPGVELLEYLAPGPGRPRPVDARASDLLHWETALAAGDLRAVEAELRAAGAGFVSPGVVELPDRALGFRGALLVRDPDGHALRIAAAAEEG